MNNKTASLAFIGASGLFSGDVLAERAVYSNSIDSGAVISGVVADKRPELEDVLYSVTNNLDNGGSAQFTVACVVDPKNRERYISPTVYQSSVDGSEWVAMDDESLECDRDGNLERVKVIEPEEVIDTLDAEAKEDSAAEVLSEPNEEWESIKEMASKAWESIKEWMIEFCTFDFVAKMGTTFNYFWGAFIGFLVLKRNSYTKEFPQGEAPLGKMAKQTAHKTLLASVFHPYLAVALYDFSIFVRRAYVSSWIYGKKEANETQVTASKTVGENSLFSQDVIDQKMGKITEYLQTIDLYEKDKKVIVLVDLFLTFAWLKRKIPLLSNTLQPFTEFLGKQINPENSSDTKNVVITESKEAPKQNIIMLASLSTYTKEQMVRHKSVILQSLDNLLQEASKARSNHYLKSYLATMTRSVTEEEESEHSELWDALRTIYITLPD